MLPGRPVPNWWAWFWIGKLSRMAPWSSVLRLVCIREVTSIETVQVLNVKLGMNVESRDLELLIEKYINDDYGDMVNYVAFSSRVDPSEHAFDPYTLGA